jgi:hypothetical protein
MFFNVPMASVCKGKEYSEHKGAKTAFGNSECSGADYTFSTPTQTRLCGQSPGCISIEHCVKEMPRALIILHYFKIHDFLN